MPVHHRRLKVLPPQTAHVTLAIKVMKFETTRTRTECGMMLTIDLKVTRAIARVRNVDGFG